jgi:SOS response regulatory protein OraA/RecX
MYLRGLQDRNEAAYQLKRLGWGDKSIETQLDLAYVIPAPMVIIQAGLHNHEDAETIKTWMEIAGIHPDWTGEYLNAVLAKPNPTDMIRWRLRSDPNLSEIGDDLTRLGVHPEYLQVFKDLAYPVPPVGDMITMAVREAFSPEIAARFGQYEDYPRDLTRYAAMNGISEEWAQRYWAAHWSLPSPQQGFAMFHRGIINHDELVMLMRALDIMPYWRDKLIEMAYLPLTRVDVRRMYALGVLDEAQVEKAYRDIGYSPVNAVLLRDFTVKQVLASQTGFKTTDVTAAFKAGYIDRTDAANMLTDLGIKSQNISHILDAGERKGKWDLQVSRMKAIENEYKQGVMNKQGVQSALEALRVPSEKVTALLGQWYKESIERESVPWTKAETMTFLQRGFIDEARAIQELYTLGFDNEHIEKIIANASYVKPKA